MKNTLQLQAADAIEVTVETAGLGSRAYAFTIDWHIRILLVLAWFLAAWLLIEEAGFGFFENAEYDFDWRGYLFVLPPAIVYFFYHPLLEILMGGRTPGKRMAGVRIVDRHGQVPGLGALLIRNVFRLIDSMPAFYGIGCVACLVTANQVRIGDLAAGTLLVYENRVSADLLEKSRRAAASADIPAAQQALLLELVDRWKSLDRNKRVGLAQQFLTRIGEQVPEAASDARRDLALFERLQELAGVSRG